MIRRAGPADEKRTEYFLAEYAETTMFLRGNLAAHGTEDTIHPHGTAFYLWEHDGAIDGVFGVTNGGYLMCRTNAAPPAFFNACVDAVKGRVLNGMTSAIADLNGVFDALGCQKASFKLRAQEPLYRLNIDTLASAGFGQGMLRKPLPTDADWLSQWFREYHAETHITPFDDPTGEKAAKQFCAKPDGRLLMVDDQPVAMSAFNARTAETAQIGGVFVPSAERGKGYGGDVVARHLLEVQAEGIEKAILFAASPYAARAYEKIGFQHIGFYELALFQVPWQVPA